jgi:hypothetical protein
VSRIVVRIAHLNSTLTATNENGVAERDKKVYVKYLSITVAVRRRLLTGTNLGEE